MWWNTETNHSKSSGVCFVQFSVSLWETYRERETVRLERNYYNMKRSETTINDQKTTRKREWNECKMNRNRRETPKDELVEHNYWMIINLLFRNLLTMSSKIEWFRNEWRQKFSNVAALGKIPRFIEILCMTYTKC